MKKIKPFLLLIIWTILGIIYAPIFIAAWVLHIVARFLLGIAYIGLLNGRRGKDVLASIFRFNPTL